MKLDLHSYNWSEPVPSRQGYTRQCQPDQAFWAAWNDDKDALKAAGLRVFPVSGGWKVGLTTSNIALPSCDYKKPEPVSLTLPTVNPAGLMPHQPAWVAQIVLALRNHNAALDASQTGTGKTYVALAVARELGLIPMVVCPKAVKPAWGAAAAHLGLSLYAVDNWEKIRYGNTPYGRWRTKTIFEWTLPKDVLLIMDEAHVCKSPKSKNGKMMLAAGNWGGKSIALSATIAESPLDMKNVGKLLGLYEKDWYKWIRSNGCIETHYGMVFIGGRRVMSRLHGEIFPRKGARMRSDSIKDFPDNHVCPELFDFGRDGTRELTSVYQSLADELKYLSEIKTKEARAQGFSAVLRARQAAEMIKVPVLADIANDLIDEGNSVAVFLSFRESLAALAKLLKTDCIVQGGQSESLRAGNIAAFQADKKRVIILNLQSGGTGISLHDLNGTYPRVSLISPSFDARLMIQALGRIHRAGTKSKVVQKIVYAAGCNIEEKACMAVAAKVGRMETLNDGDLLGAIPQFTKQ